MVVALFGVLVLFFRKPSNDRVWSKDQAVLPYADVHGTEVALHNVRNIMYRTGNDYDLRYYDAVYDAHAITDAYFMVAPFGPPGVAHTFLLFAFQNGKKLALSIEIRKKEGEMFQVYKALLPRYYEIMYVWADERDVVRLRTDIWQYKTYKIRLKVPHTMLEKLFMDAIERTNSMKDKPEFYNLFSNNCTNNLVVHMRTAGVKLPRFSWRYVFPAAIERVLEKNGIVKGSGEAPRFE